MSNQNYVKGRTSEYRAITSLKKEGYFWLTRSPASKGRFDVTGLGLSGGIALQIKRTKRQRIVPSMYKKDFEEIQSWLDELGELPEIVRIEFWIHREGIKGWTKYRFRPHTEPELFEGELG